MDKPTKFALMRKNRNLREWRIADAALVAEQEALTMRAPKPAVPTMEIDGVRYREVPEAGVRDEDGCYGCAFENDVSLCQSSAAPAIDAFGQGCSMRRVIYGKAG